MRMMIVLSSILMLLALLTSGCIDMGKKASTSAETAISQTMERTVTRTIVGSAENPDLILAEVRILEKKGFLKDVIIMESFPVQISVTGPCDIIEKLEKLPRKKLNVHE